jgi:hypothetical protein
VLVLMHASRHALNGLGHRYRDYPTHGAEHEWILRLSNVLAGDHCAVLHRDRNDGRRYETELDLRDAAHLFADVLDGHQNYVDDHHHDADDLDAHRDHRIDHQMAGDLNLGDRDRLDGHHHDAGATDDPNQNYARDLDDHHRYGDDLDAHHDRRICHLMTDDPLPGGQKMDDHDRLDDHHHDAGAMDDPNQNCVDDLDGHHHDADATGDPRHHVGDLDDRHLDADGRVVNRHDEGLGLQHHLGELDGLNHYLVLGDADRFCLV